MRKPLELTAEQATSDAAQAIEAIGIEGLLHSDGMDAFRVTSQPAPPFFGSAVWTEVRAAAPLAGADFPAIAAALRSLPGTIQVSAGPPFVIAVRRAA